MMYDKRRQDIYTLAATPYSFYEEQFGLLICPSMDHLYHFGFNGMDAHRRQDICQAFRYMHHTEASMELERKGGRIEHIIQCSRFFVTRPPDSFGITVRATAFFPIRRISIYCCKRSAVRPLPDSTVISFHYGNDRLTAIEYHIPPGNIRHDRIEFGTGHGNSTAGAQNKRDCRRPCTQVQDFPPGYRTKMSQQHRIERKAELIIALDNFHPVQDQVIEPFVRSQTNFHDLVRLHPTRER